MTHKQTVYALLQQLGGLLEVSSSAAAICCKVHVLCLSVSVQ